MTTRCENCDEGGPAAPCFGKPGCHGFWNGCDCPDCREQDQRETVETDEQRDSVAIAKADRELRRQLEEIEDPRLRAECLEAFDHRLSR